MCDGGELHQAFAPAPPGDDDPLGGRIVFVGVQVGKKSRVKRENSLTQIMTSHYQME